MDRKLQWHRADSLRQHGFFVLFSIGTVWCPSCCNHSAFRDVLLSVQEIKCPVRDGWIGCSIDTDCGASFLITLTTRTTYWTIVLIDQVFDVTSHFMGSWFTVMTECTIQWSFCMECELRLSSWNSWFALWLHKGWWNYFNRALGYDQLSDYILMFWLVQYISGDFDSHILWYIVSILKSLHISKFLSSVAIQSLHSCCLGLVLIYLDCLWIHHTSYHPFQVLFSNFYANIVVYRVFCCVD